MEKRRLTINRRTFIITAGGLLITRAFKGRLAPAHAADPPESLEFKSSVAVWQWLIIGHSGGLDSYQQGRLTVTPAGGVPRVFPIQNGSLDFSIPTGVNSDILVEVDGQSPRSWAAEFDTGTLVLKDRDYGDIPIVFHWLDLDGTYILEYWQDGLFITGRADPDGYYLGYFYRPLTALETEGRLPLRYSGSPARPDRGGSDPSGRNRPRVEPSSPIGLPNDFNSVSDGSSDVDPIAQLLLGPDIAECICRLTNLKKPDIAQNPRDSLPQQGGEMIVPDEVRIPIIPSLIALEKNGAEARLDRIDFGFMVRIDDPQGNELGTVFVGINQEVEVAGGITIRLTHLIDPPIDQIAITVSLPMSLLLNMGLGSYRLTAWVATTAGFNSNKRVEYCAIAEDGTDAVA